MQTTLIANMKGGICKTTLTRNLAYILANDYNKKVLVIDLDSQGNISDFFKVKMEKGDDHGISGLISAAVDMKPGSNDLHPEEHIAKTDYPNIDVLPANDTIAKAELKIAEDKFRPQQFHLRTVLSKIEGMYDFCLMDGPPSINNSIITINALAAADNILIPVIIDKDCFSGLFEFLDIIDVVQSYSPHLTIKGIVPQCIDMRRQLDKQFINCHDQMDNFSELPVFKAFVHESSVAKQSNFMHLSFKEFRPKHQISIDMDNVTAEYLGVEYPHPEAIYKTPKEMN